jgi:hypothetical protein
MTTMALTIFTRTRCRVTAARLLFPCQITPVGADLERLQKQIPQPLWHNSKHTVLLLAFADEHTTRRNDTEDHSQCIGRQAVLHHGLGARFAAKLHEFYPHSNLTPTSSAPSQSAFRLFV